MSVVDAIFAFDGKHVGELQAAAAGFRPEEAEKLVALSASAVSDHRVAATWIVKALCEAGQGETIALSTVFDRLDLETEWAPLLHLLQTVQHHPDLAARHRARINALMTHKKTLVAVWAMDASVRIALASGEGVQKARNSVEKALFHEKASMRARARHLAPLLGL